jgi:hypothetical protein
MGIITEGGLRMESKTEDRWIDVSPIFIVGCPRSGTTLLRLLLSAHPLISISSEGSYISHLRTSLESYGDLSNPVALARLHKDLLPYLVFEKFVSLPTFEHFLEWTNTFGTGLRSIVTFYGTWEARALGKNELTWWGDNAPYYAHHIPFFVRLFPACRFILVVRDPRDTYASIKSTFARFNIDEAVSEWERVLLCGLLAASSLGTERVHQTKYEDLVCSPRERLKEICGFLGVEYSEAMLDFYKLPAAAATAQLKHHRNLLRPVFASSVRNYRRILTSEEVSTIEERLYNPMRHYGYLSNVEYEEIGRAMLRRRVAS